MVTVPVVILALVILSVVVGTSLKRVHQVAALPGCTQPLPETPPEGSQSLQSLTSTWRGVWSKGETDCWLVDVLIRPVAGNDVEAIFHWYVQKAGADVGKSVTEVAEGSWTSPDVLTVTSKKVLGPTGVVGRLDQYVIKASPDNLTMAGSNIDVDTGVSEGSVRLSRRISD